MEQSTRSQNLKSINDYSQKLMVAFQESCVRLGEENVFNFQLAGREIAIHAAGKKLQQKTNQALLHLELNTSIVPNLSIYTWDESESGISLPTLPWENPTEIAEDSIIQFSLENFHVLHCENKTLFYLYDTMNNCAFCVIKNATILSNSNLTSPYFKIIALWASHQKLNILHAGCVAIDGKAVLIVGRGGKGKSSTSIQCLIDGLDYLSDDYVMVDLNGNKPLAYSMYSTGKLNAYHLKGFKKIPSIAKEGIVDKNNKPLLFLYTNFKNQIVKQAEIKAILTPEIRATKKTNYHLISPVESLKSLAPSTLIQLKINNLNTLNSLAQLTRKLPNFSLEIGSDFEDISTKVKEIISNL